jgi:hypothetical protein
MSIILHAGQEEGFILNALLIFKSGSKSVDYHGDMNFNNYKKWLKAKLIPNLPPNCVVIDSASYHNVKLHLAPSSASKNRQTICILMRKCANLIFTPSLRQTNLTSSC